jgi:hypothetical protein
MSRSTHRRSGSSRRSATRERPGSATRRSGRSPGRRRTADRIASPYASTGGISSRYVPGNPPEVHEAERDPSGVEDRGDLLHHRQRRVPRAEVPLPGAHVERGPGGAAVRCDSGDELRGIVGTAPEPLRQGPVGAAAIGPPPHRLDAAGEARIDLGGAGDAEPAAEFGEEAEDGLGRVRLHRVVEVDAGERRIRFVVAVGHDGEVDHQTGCLGPVGVEERLHPAGRCEGAVRGVREVPGVSVQSDLRRGHRSG